MAAFWFLMSSSEQYPTKIGRYFESTGGLHMRIPVITITLVFLWSIASATLPQAKEPPSESTQAQFVDSSGNPVGNATLTQDAQAGVRLRFNLRNLPPGTHGIHIHETGSCTKPDF